MKTRIAIQIVLILLLSGDLFASQDPVVNRLGPTLVRDLYLIEAYRDDPFEMNKERMSAYGLPLNPDPVLKVFLHLNHQPDGKLRSDLLLLVEDLYDHTWIPPVGAHRTGFMLARIKSTGITRLLKDDYIKRITAAYRKLMPLNDNSAMETRAAEVWDQDPPLRGEGIRLAILDSGFELDHGDLPQPAEAMDYADYPDTSEDVDDYISGHGTHVAGTAFGSGYLSDGRWKGMAYEAEPIYLKIGDDITSNATSAAVVGAVRAAATWCEADILTMSYGGLDGFNDGSSADEQAVDWAVGEGVTAFMSAGNMVTSKIHYMTEVPADGSTDPIQVITKYVNNPVYWGFIMSWFDSPDTSVHIRLSASVYDGEDNPVEFDEMAQVSSPRGTEAREYLSANMMPRDSTSFFIRVFNHSDQAQVFHLISYSEHWYVRFPRHSPSYTVVLPSTADSCISVGAYIARNEWTDYHGDLHVVSRDTIGKIAGFSSRGPRIDGVQKPNITAPGQRTISCRDGDNYLLNGPLDQLIISNSGEEGEPADYIAMMGTSMSSPAAAGSAALILQADPGMNPAELRHLIFSRARIDDFTGEVPNYTWGMGKMDVCRALSTPESNEDIILPEALTLENVFPNPFNSTFNIRFNVPKSGMVRFVIHDISGRKLWSTSRFIEHPGAYNFASPDMMYRAVSGKYLLTIMNDKDRVIKSVTLVK